MNNLIGTLPHQTPTNAMLGDMATQSSKGLIVQPQAIASPHIPGDMVFELTSDTSLKVKVKGSDGIVRSVTLTLA